MSRREENRQFKVTIMPIDPPAGMEGWADWETVCVPVPVPLLAYIPILLTPLRWQGRVNGTDVQKQLFSEIWEDLITRFVTASPCGEIGAAMILRQNPADSCQLQQSIDGGVTWTLAFDYSLCLPPSAHFTFTQQINNLFQQWSETTNNTEINQYAPTETFTSSPDEDEDRVNARKLALCYATNLYIAAYCEAIRKINHDNTALANLVNLAYGVAIAVAAVATIATEGATLPVYMALGAAAGAAGIAGYTVLTDSVLNDSGARTQVACLMYNNLKDAEPTAENFAAAVDGSLSGNAEIIRSTLANDISNPAGLTNQFNAFINLLGDALRPAELGLIDDCPCDGFFVLAAPDPSVDPFGQDSGIDVVSGHDYMITSEGAWTGGFSAFDADGWAGHSQFDLILPSGTTFMLIFKIGAGGAWQAGGTNVTFTASATGRLYFAMNDAIGAYTDNSGSIRVEVTEL